MRYGFLSPIILATSMQTVFIAVAVNAINEIPEGTILMISPTLSQFLPKTVTTTQTYTNTRIISVLCLTTLQYNVLYQIP